FVNELAQRALCGNGAMVGEDLRMFFPSSPWPYIRQVLGDNGGFYEFELQPVMSNVETVWRGNITSWTASEGEVYVLVLHDVTERVRVERMKTEFMSSVSHELKTPLTSIIGFQELLMERELSRDRQMRCLTICHDESKRLLHLIEDILMVARLENGSFHLHKSHNSLDDLLTKAVSNYAERYPSYTFSLVIGDENVALDYDEVLMNQVVDNLLSNAVKYTPAGGHVTVRQKLNDKHVVVSVTDDGIGIAREYIPFVFEKFYRVYNSLTRHTGGVGLGLANARHILEEHGGSIWLESQEGKGTTFFFSLPIQAC
ncbi:hypothetical protein IJT17_02330, partial [bacterium]|nr:hypothetical protein [bacterium]